MKITDELREFIEKRVWKDDYRRDNLLAIADRIDAEHEKALTEMRNRAYNEGYDEGFASADDVLSREENGMLEEHGWVRPAKDADGEFWRYGDKLEIENGLTVDIIGVSGDWLFYATENGFIHRTRAHDKRHYHAPTVEDVLTEFGIDWEHESDCEDRAALLREYAARLRLAGSDAE